MICSFIIPTRKRPERLLAAVRSVWPTVGDRAQIEIIVRMSSDDTKTIALVPQLEALGCRVIVGKVVNDYTLHSEAIDEACAAATAPWLFGMTDDSVLIGEGCNWPAQLAALPTDGVFALPEAYELGTSRYDRADTCPIVAVPNGCWQKLGWSKMDFPPDTGIFNLLRREHHWRTHYLSGLTWHHFGEPHVIG